MVEYTLTTAAHYPTQLHQAVAALKHLLTITSPSQITFGGDSAGGHLSAGLLSHVMHPSEDIEPLSLSEKLGGIAFICPFLSFNYQKESYVTCEGLDYLTLDMIKEFNKNFKPPGLSDEDAVKDPRLSPLDAPRGWWKNSPVERILLLYGTIEVFRDDNIEFGKRLKDECSPETKVDVVRCVNEVHVSCVMDQFLGFKEGDMAKSLLAWMKDSNAVQ
jgi:acetyl esterase/lipase